MTTKPEVSGNAGAESQGAAANVPAQLVKDLRERTGAGFSDCRAALVEAKGDIEKGIDVLRRKGQARSDVSAMQCRMPK